MLQSIIIFASTPFMKNFLVNVIAFVVIFYAEAQEIDKQHIRTSDGVSLYYNVGGKGPVCIFIHGGPGAWSLSFEKLGGDVLEKHLTMYYFDQRGCGRSDSPSNQDYSRERMAKDIDEIRVLSGAEKVYLLAHSFGGILAVEYATRFPEHLHGIILLNCTLNMPNSLHNQVNFVNDEVGSNIEVPSQDSILTSFIAARKLLDEKQLGYKMLSDNKATTAKLDSIDTSMKRNSSFARYAISSPVYFQDFSNLTPTVKTPVLVITGKKDHSIGPEHYKLFKFPNQVVKVIDGGHVLYHEQNKVFENTVIDFVE